MRRVALGLAAFFALGVALVAAGTFDGAAFSESFPGAPAAPMSWDGMDWDVVVHSRAVSSQFEGMTAGHGDDCSPAPGTHAVTSFDGVVFQCRDHVMTAINSDQAGYAAVYLTPAAMADWSAGETVIRWDVSTEIMSTRDWWTVTLSPWNANMAFPLANWYPDGDGLPNEALELRLSPSWRNVCPVVVANGVEGELSGCAWWASYDQNGVPQSPITRTTFEARISADHLRISIPSAGLVWYDGPISLPFAQAVVQFGHHSYTPTKDGAGVPGTWHWDNVSISPAVPFTILKAAPESARDTAWDPLTVTFPAAPAGARLRFTSISDVALVNGQPCQSQPSNRADPWGHASSFFCPIPAGSTMATVQGVRQSGWPANAQYEGFAVWAPGAPAATATPVPSTATYTPTATNTVAPPTATPTNTAVPPTPTATPAPIGACRIQWDAPGGSVSYSTLGTRQLTRAQCQALLSMLVP